MSNSNYGNWRVGVGDHPICSAGGELIEDITVEEYYYPSHGYIWPSAQKLWIINSFESWDAGYDVAEGNEKPNSWAPYYMTIASDSDGQLYGNLTRADGLGGTGDLWHVYPQNVGSSVSLKDGTWNRIKFRCKLNTPGLNDGIFKLWINGELKCNYEDINFRGTYVKFGWNHLMMTMNASSIPQTQWVSRDDIKIVAGTGVYIPTLRLVESK